MSEATWTRELRSWLDVEARAAGFDAAGIAAVHPPGEPAATAEADRFDSWIGAGHAGEMEYLKRRNDAGILLRSGLQAAMPWARSAVVCALNYNADAPRSLDPAPPAAGWIARYAWSGRDAADGASVPTDYHDELLARLRAIEAALQTKAGGTMRSYVDTGPMVERTLAARAGIGWIGKNMCVIRQGTGSWLLLGVIVTSLALPEELAVLPAADRCGSCTRCIDACPTDALLGSKTPGSPRSMDASRCIAYLTIEKKGSIDEDLRPAIGRHVFGCDICQEVCPWNRTAPIGTTEDMQPRRELVNPALDWLAEMDSAAFRRAFRGSPLERTGRKRLLRNVAIAMGNTANPRHLGHLDVWSAGADPVLAEAAQWAAARIRSVRGETAEQPAASASLDGNDSPR